MDFFIRSALFEVRNGHFSLVFWQEIMTVEEDFPRAQPPKWVVIELEMRVSRFTMTGSHALMGRVLWTGSFLNSIEIGYTIIIEPEQNHLSSNR